MNNANIATRRIILLIGLVLTAGLIYYLLRFSLGGAIVIDLKDVDMTNSEVLVNGKEQGLYGYNEKSQTMKLVNVIGKQEITVHSAGYETYSTTENVIMRGTKTVKAARKESSAEAEAKEFVKDLGLTDKIISATYQPNILTNERYLVITTESDGIQSTLTGLFNASKGVWELPPNEQEAE